MAREPHWNGHGRASAFGEQERHQCILDLDKAREVGTDTALADWFRKWDRNIETAIWQGRHG